MFSESENMVLCGANSYTQKYYFNEEFDRLPESVKDELKAMCVIFTEDIGGILTLEYTEEGELEGVICKCLTDRLLANYG